VGVVVGALVFGEEVGNGVDTPLGAFVGDVDGSLFGAFVGV
jgi:hypothetical protein